MLKVRVTFTDYDDKKNKELEDFLNIINKNKDFEVLSISDKYKGRGNSKYSSIYVDIEKK